MCDECDFAWLEPERRTLDDSVFPDMHTFEIPGTTLAVGGGSAGWATRAEVERAGWAVYVAGERPTPSS